MNQKRNFNEYICGHVLPWIYFSKVKFTYLLLLFSPCITFWNGRVRNSTWVNNFNETNHEFCKIFFICFLYGSIEDDPTERKEGGNINGLNNVWKKNRSRCNLQITSSKWRRNFHTNRPMSKNIYMISPNL